MGKGKRPTAPSSDARGDVAATEGAALLTDEEAVRAAFVEVETLAKQWMEKEREGIALIENFQTALLATRADGATTRASAPMKQQTVMDVFITGGSDATQMDPWLAEDLFAQIQELPDAFTELLEQMYTLHNDTQTKLCAAHSNPLPESNALELTMADYAQFVAYEVATFEAEYQHIETLLAMISFAVTTDQLRTLVISWSTSPFLDPERSRAFRQRHEQSQKLKLR